MLVVRMALAQLACHCPFTLRACQKSYSIPVDKSTIAMAASFIGSG